MELSIQERLKDLRVERGLTLEQLAEQTHLSKSALGSYEGDNFKDISHYIGLCLAYFHIVWKQEGCYYCSEFVGELLAKSRVDGTEQLRSSIIQPMQFLRMPHTLLYRGKLREYMCDTCSEGICEDAANRTVHRRLP